MRTDFAKTLLAEVKELGVPIIRYPGGNFVSGYNWLDGVGPKDQAADRSGAGLEFPRDESVRHQRIHGMVQTGRHRTAAGLQSRHRHTRNGRRLVEYCNVEKGTKWSDLRRQHGYEQPHKVKYWCLGNEMDGPWQMGHMPAREYGRKARDTARQIRVIDPDAKLIACGSSNTILPTYLTWDREVLEECYDQVDGISLHNYYGNTEALTGNNTARYLAMNLDMERQIHEIARRLRLRAGIAEVAQAPVAFVRRMERLVSRARAGFSPTDSRTFAPQLLEEVYNLEDALLVGGFLNTLLRQSERVRVGLPGPDRQCHRPARHQRDLRACARASIIPTPGRSSTPAETCSICRSSRRPIRSARRGSGRISPVTSQVPYLDVVATIDPQNGQVCFLMLNRDLDSERELVLEWRDPTPVRVLACETLTGTDLKAFNTFEQPKRVAPQPLEAPKAAARMTFKLPPSSYSVAHIATT